MMANNRLAYGLAKEHGIDTEGMSPEAVWRALEEKGIKVKADDGDWDEQEELEDFFPPIKQAKKKRRLELPKKEYASLCSAIRTKYGNKIPRNYYLLYGDYFYEFNYSRDSKITCVSKMLINGNEDIISAMERKNEIKRKKR